jgi:hypothetical protein
LPASERDVFVLRSQRDALAEALRGLFEHCAMIHKRWGDGSNVHEAAAALNNARAALALVDGVR